MRTPGRCTNVEGCWISASHRDVWLSVGEEFVCPNCGGPLTAPPRTTMARRSFRQVAAGGFAFTMAAAATVLVAFRLATQPLPSPKTILALVTPEEHRPTAAQLQQPADIAAIPQLPVSMPPAAISTRHAGPAARPNSAASRRALAALSRQPLTLYTAPPALKAAGPAATPAPAAPEPPATITLVSDTPIVPPPSTQRPVILPISFGEPPKPEDALAPVSRSWRHRGMVMFRHNRLLPAPGGANRSAIGADALCDTPSELPQ